MKLTLNFNAIIKMSGVLLFVVGLSFFLPIIVAIYFHEIVSLYSFLSVGCISLILGLVIMKFFSPSSLKTKARDGFAIVTVCWLIASLVGALPFYISGAIPSYIDAFFETCSGFSTTGASILNEIEKLPKSMLMYRSFTHWLGGMGIIVFAAALLPSIGIGGQVVASAEAPGPVLTKISARFSDMAKKLYYVYIFFTITEVILLCLGGLNLYDSLIHSFGTVGTGGFSNYSQSVGAFKSSYVQWVIIVFMILCGINFNLYFYIIKGNIKSFFKDEELKRYLQVVGLFSIIITIVLLFKGGYVNIPKAFRDSTFQVASIITTTGYSTANFNTWPTLAKVLIFFCMISGACSSSTGGGVKVIRILAAIKLMKRVFYAKLHPNRVGDITINSVAVTPTVITHIVNFIFFMMVILFAGTFLISFDGFDIITNITAVLTCVCNVGPGFNMVGPDGNFSIFSDFSKFILSIMMIAGRLELFTFFIVFSPYYWNSNKA